MVKKTGKRYRPGPAKEFTDELMKDPAFVARLQERERIRQEHVANYQEAAKGVLADLADAGFDVHSVGELVQQFARDHVPYRAAIPILMKWLPRVAYVPLKDDIIRTLSVPWAKPVAARLMVEEFVKEPEGWGGSPLTLRWVIGNALWVVADDTVFDDLVRIATDRGYGRNREMVVEALANIKDRRAIKVLVALLDDEDVAGHAVVALGKLKAREARPHLERFLQHPKAWVRKEAKKATKAIDNT